MFLVDLLFRFAGFSFARWFPVWPLVFIYIGQTVCDTSNSNFFGGELKHVCSLDRVEYNYIARIVLIASKQLSNDSFLVAHAV